MRPDQTNKFHLFPGTDAQWNDSLKRAAVIRRYHDGKNGPLVLALAFLEVPAKKQALAAAEYARSIHLP